LAQRPAPTPEVVAELQRLDADIREMRYDGADDDPWRAR
jgi:hypothetical protein